MGIPNNKHPGILDGSRLIVSNKHKTGNLRRYCFPIAKRKARRINAYLQKLHEENLAEIKKLTEELTELYAPKKPETKTPAAEVKSTINSESAIGEPGIKPKPETPPPPQKPSPETPETPETSEASETSANPQETFEEYLASLKQ